MLAHAIDTRWMRLGFALLVASPGGDKWYFWGRG